MASTYPDYPDLTTLDTTQVEAALALMKSSIAATAASADLQRGVLHDLVVQLNAVLTAALETELDAVRSSSSFALVDADPAGASTIVLDRLASNYNVTRVAAAKASGQVVIVLNAFVPTIIPANSSFTISGLTFVTLSSFFGRTSGGLVVQDTDRLITSRGDGTYQFTVDVEASATGSAGNVLRAAPASLAAPPANYVSAHVLADFTGGMDEETNAALRARLLAGAAHRSWGCRSSVDGLLREEFPETVAVSTIGCGDPEQARDRHGLFPLATGGRADVVVRPAQLYRTVAVTVTATLKVKTGPVGTWQAGINRDAAPGFYEPVKVLLPSQAATATGFAVSSDTRSYDVSGTIYIPDITTAVEAAYSRYQTSVMRWDDNITDASALTVDVSTKQYVIVLRVPANIADMQTFLSDVSRRPLGSDVLVRAAVPCFCALTCTVRYPSGSAVPDTDAIKTAVALAVNTQGFVSKLHVSTLTAAITAIRSDFRVDTVTLTGRIRKPDGTTTNLSNAEVITIPSAPVDYVTSSTTVFYLETGSITLSTATY